MANANSDLMGNTLSGHSPVLTSEQRPLSNYAYSIFQNIGTMSAYLLDNGYTFADIVKMTKNDLVNACRLAGAYDAVPPPPEGG